MDEDVSPMELMENYWENKVTGDLRLFEDLEYSKIVNLESFFVVLLHQEFKENEFPINKLYREWWDYLQITHSKNLN
jgi:hypothetical protein